MATLRGGSTAPDALTGDLGRPLPWAAPSRQEKAGAPMPSVHRLQAGTELGLQKVEEGGEGLVLAAQQGPAQTPRGNVRLRAGPGGSMLASLPGCLWVRGHSCSVSPVPSGWDGRRLLASGSKAPPSPWEAGNPGLGSNGRRELRALILGRKSPLGPAPGSQQLWRDPRVVPAPPPPLGAPGPGVRNHGVWFTHSPLQVKLPLPPGSGVNHVTGPITRTDWLSVLT
uniref:Uncharacterized protein n=1 Tax=Myotis myotis TaxID=51298 RepID=A0A7J7VIG0_MYOMY|nr:hypothetical protein mMyoMyo1_008407 [Myotis myotis]